MDQLVRFEKTVSAHLGALLSEQHQTHEIMRPPKLVAAMRHAVLNGGKRFRPYLLMETAALFGVPESHVLQTACALECVHCYSLVHDDLPAMDDDDMRRGQPTVHRKFDEATAILAGDALLTLAFELVSEHSPDIPADVRSQLTFLLARAAGQGGMLGGQILDLEAENTTLTRDQVTTMQRMKTGALIRYACEAGALIGEAGNEEREALIAYGDFVGRAFQLADDLLDVTSSEAEMGKAVAKDSKRGKETIVSQIGLSSTRELLDQMVRESDQCLEIFGERGAQLKAIARFVVTRKS